MTLSYMKWEAEEKEWCCYIQSGYYVYSSKDRDVTQEHKQTIHNERWGFELQGPGVVLHRK